MITATSLASRITAVLEAGTDRMAPATLISGHVLHHAYDYGLYVVLPALYTDLGLTPVAAGLMDTVRRVSSGVAAIGGGLLIGL